MIEHARLALRGPSETLGEAGKLRIDDEPRVVAHDARANPRCDERGRSRVPGKWHRLTTWVECVPSSILEQRFGRRSQRSSSGSDTVGG
jgi:hypothetical protein